MTTYVNTKDRTEVLVHVSIAITLKLITTFEFETFLK